MQENKLRLILRVVLLSLVCAWQVAFFASQQPVRLIIASPPAGVPLSAVLSQALSFFLRLPPVAPFDSLLGPLLSPSPGPAPVLDGIHRQGLSLVKQAADDNLQDELQPSGSSSEPQEGTDVQAGHQVHSRPFQQHLLGLIE